MKKIKFSLCVIKIYMKNQMQDKTNLILDMINMIARCLVVFLLYSYIFQLSDGNINGIDYKTTMWSMFIYFCIMTLNLRSLDKIIMSEIKSGNVEMFLNKPINYLFLSFLKVIGQGLYSFLFISFLGIIIMLLFIGIPIVNWTFFIPTFIITFLLGQSLGLMIYGIIGIAAFFIEDNRPIHWIVDKMVMILGGSYLPISMFPNFMKLIAFLSPFGAINFATSTVYSDWEQEFILRLLIQMIWITISGLLLRFMFHKAKVKAMINGG